MEQKQIKKMMMVISMTELKFINDVEEEVITETYIKQKYLYGKKEVIVTHHISFSTITGEGVNEYEIEEIDSDDLTEKELDEIQDKLNE